MPRNVALLVAVTLVALVLSGCTEVPDFDFGDDDRPRPGDDPDPYASCKTGENYTWVSKNHDIRGTGTETFTDCWWNGNLSDSATHNFSFYFGREKGSGSVDVTVEDGDGEIFLNHSVGSDTNVVCQEHGRQGAPGNWSVRWDLTDFSGKLELWIDMWPRQLGC